MKTIKHSTTVTRFISKMLMLSLCMGIMIGDKTRNLSGPGAVYGKNSPARKAQDKISPDLRARVDGARVGADSAGVNIILQLNSNPGSALSALLKRNGVRVKKAFRNLNARSVELPASVIEELAAHSEVDYLSLDREVRTLGHVSLTAGADAVRTQTTAFGTSYALDGTGIGIAVLDSGI